MTLWLVNNGAVVAGMMSGGFSVLLFKLSELLTVTSMTRARQALFVLKAVVAQIISLYIAMFYAMKGWRDLLGPNSHYHITKSDKLG